MGNLNFQVIPDRTDSGPEAIVRIQAVGKEFRGAIKTLIEEAIAEGVRIAKQNAPRGDEFHHGVRISDAIYGSPVRYHPGGAGGGGYYEGTFGASSFLAPHLRWVFEGTGERGLEPTGRIYGSRGNVMTIQKEGEPISFVRWTRGQRAQQRWWTDAEEHADATLAAGIRSLQIP